MKVAAYWLQFDFRLSNCK